MYLFAASNSQDTAYIERINLHYFLVFAVNMVLYIETFYDIN